jgi:predicted HAD superfamily hydrolase
MKDAELQEYSRYMQEYTVFSFDIFDTLLYRKCEKPIDVFALTWDKAVEKYGQLGMSSEEYREYRRHKEQEANQKHAPKQGYDFIFDEMELSPELKEFLKTEELVIEKEVVYLNEYVYDLIEELKKNNKEVILVSDMYHSSAVLSELLSHAGCDMSYISKLYVSSEYDCHKGKGKLFQKVMEDYPALAADKFIHVGDNINGDYEGGKQAGWTTVLYTPHKI